MTCRSIHASLATGPTGGAARLDRGLVAELLRHVGEGSSRPDLLHSLSGLGEIGGSDLDSLLTPDGGTTSTPLATGTQARSGLLIYRFGASLYYANATRFTAEIIDLAANADPPLKWFGLSASAIGDIDYSGADAIRAVVEDLRGRGVTFVMAEVDMEVQALLDAYGLTDRIGKENIYPTSHDIAEAFGRATARGPSDE